MLQSHTAVSVSAAAAVAADLEHQQTHRWRHHTHPGAAAASRPPKVKTDRIQRTCCFRQSRRVVRMATVAGSKGEVVQEEEEEMEEDKSTWKLVIIDPEVGQPTTVINDNSHD